MGRTVLAITIYIVYILISNIINNKDSIVDTYIA